MTRKMPYTRIAQGALAVVFGAFAFELIQPASSLLLTYAATLTGPTQQQALSAPTGLIVAVLAAFVAGWAARGALRVTKSSKAEDSTINSG